MKKAGTITKISLFVITALVVLTVSFPRVVNATEASQNQDSEIISTENKTSKKERKGKKDSSETKTKYENLKDEEKDALKAKREAKFKNMTDEEKQALKNKKLEKKERKNNNAENSQNAK